MPYRPTNQKYIDLTIHEAIIQGCDTVQLKYDGEFKVYDELGTQTCVLLGNAFPLPRWVDTEFAGKLIIWDCLFHDAQDIRHFSYRNRFAFARLHCQRLDSILKLATPYPIGTAAELWRLAPKGTKGLVYRNSMARYSAPVGVARRYDEVPGELP